MADQIMFGGEDTIIVGSGTTLEDHIMRVKWVGAFLLVVVLLLVWWKWDCLSQLCKSTFEGMGIGGSVLRLQEFGTDGQTAYIPASEGYTSAVGLQEVTLQGQDVNPYLTGYYGAEGVEKYMNASKYVSKEGYMNSARATGDMLRQLEKYEGMDVAPASVDPNVVAAQLAAADAKAKADALAALVAKSQNKPTPSNSDQLLALMKQTDLKALQTALQCPERAKDYNAHLNAWGTADKQLHSDEAAGVEGMNSGPSCGRSLSANSHSDDAFTSILHGQ